MARFNLPEPPPPSRRLAMMLCWVGLASALATPHALHAQTPAPISVPQEVFPGSQIEEYLRLLQTVGHVAPYPWSLRGFGAQEIDRLVPQAREHPWAGRYTLSSGPEDALHFGWVRPEVAFIFNSSAPYGYNDGAVWAGRGITTFARFGFSVRKGPLSLVVAPEVFSSQNRAFAMIEGNRTGDQRFADPAFPTTIDLPQRFGDGAYTMLTPGQSTLRLDLLGVSAAISTANQHWGPVWDQPLILGTNAAGFPHAFVGTATPVNLWIGDLHGRVVWGALSQSEYAPAGSDSDRRFMAGMVGVFRPRGMQGLELGGSRFFHRAWPDGGPRLDDFFWPFQSLLKKSLSDTGSSDLSNSDNQIASVFARWTLPRGGAELYAEYAREDHSWNLRDLALEPDHDSGFAVGMSKAWTVSPERIVSLRAEVMDAQVTHLAQVRPQTPLYRHSRQRQGHTHFGQILGAASGYAGGSARMATDLYHPGGRLGVGITRSLRRVPVPPGTELSALGQGADVLYATEVSGTFFLGRFDVDAAITPIYEFNRDLRGDAFNLNAQLQVRARM